MQSVGLFLYHLIDAITPATRGFRTRRRLLRRLGVGVGRTARVNGRVVFQGINVSIGEGSWIGWGSRFVTTQRSEVLIGDNCDISQEVLFICGGHEMGGASRRAGSAAGASIRVGSGTWVGARATFLGGAEVGEGCVVGAGSLVRSRFGDNLVIAGVPARVVKTLE